MNDSSLVVCKPEGLEIKSADGVVKVRDRHTAYRLAFLLLTNFLTKHGFETNCPSQGATALSFGFKNLLFDLKLAKPSKIAYITSSKSYIYSPDKINATVVKMNDVLKDAEYVLQVIGSGRITLAPIYVPLPKVLPEEPTTHVIRSALFALRELAQQLATIGDTALQDAIEDVEPGRLTIELLEENVDSAVALLGS